MTVLRAERITGLSVRQIPDHPPGPTFKYEAYDDSGVVAAAADYLPGDALNSLVNKVYKARSLQVFEEQGFRDFVTGGIVPLQCDHIIPRARGRNDRRENLRGVGAISHQKITDNILVDPEPHPKVAESMARYGWKWGGDKWLRIGV